MNINKKVLVKGRVSIVQESTYRIYSFEEMYSNKTVGEVFTVANLYDQVSTELAALNIFDVQTLSLNIKQVE